MLNKKDQVRNLSVKISSTLKDAEIIYDAFCEVIEEGILADGKVKVGNKELEKGKLKEKRGKR